MKKISLVIAFLSFTLINAQSEWAVDGSHSSVRFSVDHMVISEVEGQFTKFEGTFTDANEDFSKAAINFKIDVNSVDTANEKRDAHLKNEDFFDAAKYPSLDFKSTSIEKVKENKYLLKGFVSLHGITKEVSLDMSFGGIIKDPWGGTRAGIKVSGTIDRTDFNLKYNSVMEAGGVMIGEDIDITAKLELVKK